MTKANALTQLTAKSLPPGKHFDGQGLMLVKSRKDAGKWVVRLVVDGKRREMGLGRWPDVSIAEARESARNARIELRNGTDPVRARQRARRTTAKLTVRQAIEGCFKAKQADLKGDGKAGRWMSPLQTHVLPVLGETAIEDVDQHDFMRVLEPIWHKKPDSARKALNRLNLTLKHATALGLEVDLLAPMKARALLGKQRHERMHIPSLPYAEAPAFYQWLCTKKLTSAYALRFLMLTATRTSEVRFATWDEIDGDLWTIPAKRTKTNQVHRVPLSEEALRTIECAPRVTDSQLLFPTARGKAMSDATMSRLMEREGYTARPHGLRATFRTWVEETTDTPYEVKEMALGHKVGSEVERAYQRSDLIEHRRKLMITWNDHLAEYRNFRRSPRRS